MLSRKLLVACTVLLLFCVAPVAQAQLPQTSAGLGYLDTSKNPDGTWGGDTARVEITAATISVLETLKLLNQTAGTPYTTGTAWLQAQTPRAVALMGQRNRFLGLADYTTLVAAADTVKGGWGGYDGHERNPLDTSAALQALKSANYPDQTVINPALAYLTGSQNPDGGWGFSAGDDSNVFLTAIVSATLQQFPQTTVVATAVSKATVYLLAHQNADGGFSSSTSTVYETALAYASLAAVTTNEAALSSAVVYLTTNQTANGSWNDDPYSTALALKALYLSENRPSPPPPPPAAGKFSGTVLDAATRQGVSGVAVVLEGSPLINTVTDATGNFLLADVPPGTRKVVFSLSGYASTAAAATSIADVTTSLGMVAMTSAFSTGTISGIIYDPIGKPLADTIISVSGSWSGSAVSGLDGAFSFAYVTPGDVSITANKTGYHSFAATGRVYPRTILSISPRLSTTASTLTTGTITGRVVSDMWGLPIDHLPDEQGVRVTISGGAYAEPDPDNGGKFTISGLAPNTYQVTVGMNGFASQTFNLIITPGVTTDLGTIRLAMIVDTMTLTGTVTDSVSGLPIQSAEIFIAEAGRTARTDFAGSYVIADIKIPEFTVKASAAGYTGKTYLVSQGGGRAAAWEQTMNITLTPQITTGGLTGTVVDASSGQPLSGVTLALASDPNIVTTTNSSGAFSFQELHQGMQQVNISLDGYSGRTLTTAILPGVASNVGSIPIALTALSATVRGKILDGTINLPFAGVTVQVSGSEDLQAFSAADGTYTIDAVPPGNISVVASQPGYYPARFTASLEPGGILIFNPALFKALAANVAATVATDKQVYQKGETVGISVTAVNRQSVTQVATLHLRVADPASAVALDTTMDANLTADGSLTLNAGLPLPVTAEGGLYMVTADLYDAVGTWIGSAVKSFGVAVSRITITPVLPPAFTTGANTVSFTLVNNGELSVSSGGLALTLKDPDGQVVAAAEQSFGLGLGESKAITSTLTIPALKFGTYTLAYVQSDETRTGKVTEIALPNTMTISAVFDSNSHRVRNTAGLTLTLVNSGRFNPEAGMTMTVAVPDADFSESKLLAQALAVGSVDGTTLLYQFPIPSDLAAGEHNAIVTVALPGGSSISKGTKLVIFEAALSLAPLQGSYAAGEIISPVIANSGGVDAPVLYRLSLYDANARLIADKSSTESAVAGSTLTPGLIIPSGAVDGSYSLVINYKDLTTGGEEIVTHPLTISGVKGGLQVRTDKQSYLSTENITALSGISNSGTPLQNGNLHLQVSTTAGSQQQKTWTSQYDFQQGVRIGVDTYGVNDWMIPDDYFDLGFDTLKWNSWGSVQTQNEKLFVDSTTYGSGVNSKWYISGDFDIQVDFDSNNSVGAEGAGIGVGNGKSWFYVKNTLGNGREAGAQINGNWTGWNAIGGYQQSGKFRVVRTGSTLIGYSWNGTGWTQLLSVTNSSYTGNSFVGLDVWRGQGRPASCKFDNFKVNTGRIITNSETVNSVRLLPINDNHDDGTLNSDRWTAQSSGSAVTNEANGSLVSKVTQTGTQSSSNITGRFPLEGDFDIFVDWKTPAAPSSGEWGAAFQVTEIAQSTFPENNIAGNAIQIKRAYINGIGHVYQVGHYNGSSWDSWSSPVATSDTSGRFRIKRVGANLTAWYWNNSLNRWEWNGNVSGFVWSSGWTTPTYVESGVSINNPNSPAVEFNWNNFKAGNGVPYALNGTIHLLQDAGRSSTWQTINWNSTIPLGTSIKFRTRTAESETGLATAAWSDYLTASGSPISSPSGRWIEIEAALATTDSNITPLLHDVTVTYGSNPGDILWQADVPVNLAQGALADLNSTIDALGSAGKYYLQGTLTSSTGQTVTSAEYPFYVVQGNTVVRIAPDRKLYKPGETVTISGEVANLATIEAANLALTVKAKAGTGIEQSLFADSFTIPAGGNRPFNVTTTAGTDGVVNLTATVVQNTTVLAAVADQYEVASPKVVASLSGPDTAGSEPFTLTLNLVNSGKTDAAISVATSFGSPAELVLVPAGQTRVLQYQQKLTADMTLTFSLSGDLTQQLSKTIVHVAPKQAATLSAKIVTDRIAYNANEKVAITSTITCLNAGTTGDSLAATVMIVSSGGEALFTDRMILPALDAGRVHANSRYWNSAAYSPGTYTARVVVDGGGVVLATAEATFTILPTSASAAGVAGTLSAAENPVYLGVDQSLAVNLVNGGNEELIGATCSVIVVNPDTQAIMQTYSRTVNLPRQGMHVDNIVLPTASLEERDYLAILQITTPGLAEAKTLAGVPFSVKIAPPPVLFLSTLSSGAVTNNQTLNITGSATGVVAIQSVMINGTAVPFNSDGSFSHALLLQPGSNALIVTVTDVLQHTDGETREIILDQTAPALVINKPADNSKTAVSPIEVTGSVDEASTVAVKMNELVQAAAMNRTDFTSTLIPEPGWNTIEVTATDLAGNTSSQKRSVLFNDQKPSLSVTEPDQDIRTNKSSLTIGGTASDPYTAVGVTVSTEGTMLTPAVIDGRFSQVVAFNEEKLYPITVTATNEVGTQTSVQRNIIYDGTPPVLTIDPVVTPTNAPGQVITGTREEGTDVIVNCATARLGAVEYPTATTWRLSIAGLTQGENRLRAEATDLAGNRTTAIATILYVPKAPDVTVSASPNRLWPPNKKMVPVVLDGNVVTYGSDIREVSISIADEYGTYNQQGLEFGDTVLLEAWRDGNDKDGRVYTVTAVVTDQAGNVTTKSATVIVSHDMGK